MSGHKHRKYCGIYKITNLNNLKIYVGSSKDIKGRWYKHKSQLNKNKHGNCILQNSWNKHGGDAFQFSIVEECASSELKAKEQFYLDTWTPQYNIVKGAYRPPSFHEWNEESKAKRATPVIATCLKTGEKCQYSTMSSVAQDGFDQRSVLRVCQGQKASHKGWRWEYADGSSPPNNCKAYLTDVTFIRIDSEGNEVEYANSASLKVNGFDPNKVRQVCKGERGRRSHKGYKWRFKEQAAEEFFADRQQRTFKEAFYKAVQSYDLNSNKIVKTYASQAETKLDGFDQRKVSACCLGKRKSHGGLGWKFAV